MEHRCWINIPYCVQVESSELCLFITLLCWPLQVAVNPGSFCVIPSVFEHFPECFRFEELEDQFFALDKYNLIKYLNKSAKQRFGENLIDKNISSVIRDTKLLEEIDEAIKDQSTKNVNVEINLPGRSEQRRSATR